MRARLRRQWGFGPLFALEAIMQIVKVRHEAIAAIERQRREERHHRWT